MNRIIGVIPARSGSKGIPDKNMRTLAGRPLLEYAAQAAADSGIFDRVIVSTNSVEIATIAESLGLDVPFMRPAELARDDTPMLPVLQHAVTTLESVEWFADIIVLLQPTAPLRQPRHLVDALTALVNNPFDSVVSVTRIPKHYSPQFAMKIVNGNLVNYLSEGKKLTRRQDVENAYSRDGTVYAVRRDVLMKKNSLYGDSCHPLVIPPDESINLDTMEDWLQAEEVLNARSTILKSSQVVTC